MEVCTPACVIDTIDCGIDIDIECGIDTPLDITCTPLDGGEFIIDAIALSNAAWVERLGALREIPWTLLVMLWVEPIDVWGELGTWLGRDLLMDVNAVHCLWLSPVKNTVTVNSR